MTIDEAIMIEKYYGKKDEKALEELQNKFPMIEGITDNNLHEQIAEWLEELKKYKSYKPVDKEFYKAGYTKAIDDFVTKLKEEKFNGYETLEDYFENYIECVSVEDIDMIAEQLKEGSADNE